MFKTQLSSNLIPEKVVIAILPLIAFFSWHVIPLDVVFVVFILMLVFVPYSIYTIYMAPANVSYDASFVFITDRKTEKIVALKSITQVKPSQNNGSLRKRWEINYIENGAEEQVFFYPKDGSMSLMLFIKAVRAQNPMAHCADVN